MYRGPVVDEVVVTEVIEIFIGPLFICSLSFFNSLTTSGGIGDMICPYNCFEDVEELEVGDVVNLIRIAGGESGLLDDLFKEDVELLFFVADESDNFLCSLENLFEDGDEIEVSTAVFVPLPVTDCEESCEFLFSGFRFLSIESIRLFTFKLEGLLFELLIEWRLEDVTVFDFIDAIEVLLRLDSMLAALAAAAFAVAR